MRSRFHAHSRSSHYSPEELGCGSSSALVPWKVLFVLSSEVFQVSFSFLIRFPERQVIAYRNRFKIFDLYCLWSCPDSEQTELSVLAACTWSWSLLVAETGPVCQPTAAGSLTSLFTVSTSSTRTGRAGNAIKGDTLDRKIYLMNSGPSKHDRYFCPLKFINTCHPLGRARF